jgi:hypothetical protein
LLHKVSLFGSLISLLLQTLRRNQRLTFKSRHDQAAVRSLSSIWVSTLQYRSHCCHGLASYDMMKPATILAYHRACPPFDSEMLILIVPFYVIIHRVTGDLGGVNGQVSVIESLIRQADCYNRQDCGPNHRVLQGALW